MPNEFVARNGVVALNNSIISGSSSGIGVGSSILEVTHTGSVSPVNVATFRNPQQNNVRISLAASDRSFQIGVNGFADGGSIIGNLNISSGTPTLRLMNANETTTFLSLSANTTTGVVTATTSASSAPIILQNNGLTTTGSLNVNGSITGSNILVTGTLTAQTIVAQVITSSTDFVTGSTRFGSLLTNTHQFTGSVGITGSLTVTGGSSFTINDATNASRILQSTTTYRGAGLVHQWNNNTVFAWNNTSFNFVHINTGNDVINIDRSVLSSGTTSGAALEFVNGGSFAPTTGTNTFNLIRVSTVYNATGGTNTINGILYNPTLTSLTGTTHNFINASTGNVILASTSGNVSIGKSAPSATLDVSGSTLITGSVSITGSLTVTGATSSLLVNELVIGPSAGSPKISFTGTGFGSYISSDGYIIEYNTRQDTRSHIFRQGGVLVGRIGTQDSAGADTFEILRGSGLTESFAVSSSGEVRVNTSTGLGYQFDVNGTGNFRSDVNITGSLTVAPSGNRELQVASTGVSIGNAITDAHVVTGSVRLSGSMEIGPTLSNSSAQLLVTGTSTRTKGIIVSSSWDYQTSWAMWNGIFASEFNLGGATKSANEGGPGSFQVSLYNANTLAFRYPITAYANGNVFIGGPSTSVPADTGESLQVSGSGRITNNLTVTGSLIAPNITGSLQGTSSWALNVVGGGGSSFSLNSPGAGRVILSDGSANAATASANLTYVSSTLNITGSVNITGSAVTSSADMLIQGRGTTSSTFALTVRNSSGTDLFAVRNDGGAIFLYSECRAIGAFQTDQITTRTTGNVSFPADISLGDTKNLIVGSTTGAKIATATTQKLGFWNATPVVQPTTAVASATFVANTGTAVNNASTFDGYTLQQVVRALRTIGILA